uniref:Uncharacterized protein n=1 Tax=Manihot esculenta TaxID=3983 RepID=A0A2C9VKS1_MANES
MFALWVSTTATRGDIQRDRIDPKLFFSPRILIFWIMLSLWIPPLVASSWPFHGGSVHAPPTHLHASQVENCRTPNNPVLKYVARSQWKYR